MSFEHDKIADNVTGFMIEFLDGKVNVLVTGPDRDPMIIGTVFHKDNTASGEFEYEIKDNIVKLMLTEIVEAAVKTGRKVN